MKKIAYHGKIREIQREVYECSGCSKMVECNRRKGIYPRGLYGSPKGPIMIVGLNPGRMGCIEKYLFKTLQPPDLKMPRVYNAVFGEDTKGYEKNLFDLFQPIFGKKERILDHCYFTNLVKCQSAYGIAIEGRDWEETKKRDRRNQAAVDHCPGRKGPKIPGKRKEEDEGGMGSRLFR